MLRRYDAAQGAFVCQLPESNRSEFYLHPAVVRRNDTSAKSINEWTQEKILMYATVIHSLQLYIGMHNVIIPLHISYDTISGRLRVR